MKQDNPSCPRCGGCGKVEEYGRGWIVIDVVPCPACRKDE